MYLYVYNVVYTYYNNNVIYLNYLDVEDADVC